MTVFAFLLAAPVLPEEEMAIAEDFLGVDPGESASFLGQYGAWLIFGAAVLLAIFVMLSMIAGRYRRQRAEAGYHDDPLFDDDDQDTETFNPAFAEVIIEDTDEPKQPFAPTLQRRGAYAGDAEAGADDADAGRAVSFEGSSDEPLEESDPADTREEIAVDDEPDTVSAPNVVRLRAPEDDRARADRAPEDDEDTPEPTEPQSGEVAAEEEREDEQVLPRYAFGNGNGRGLGVDAGYQRVFPEQPAYRAPMGGSQNTTSEERPYGTSFQRDDVERVERRQSERINRMRDEFATELSTLKAEQASRLDLIISTIDRKLDRVEKGKSDTAIGAAMSDEMSRGLSSLNDRIGRLSSAIDAQQHMIRSITQTMEGKLGDPSHVSEGLRGVSEDIRAMRSEFGTTAEAMGSIRQDLDTVREHVERLERAVLDRASHESSTAVRLADVVRGTLPDGTYELNAPLSTGETADCLITYEGLSSRIAIDAGFPMDAFQELPSRDAVRRNLPQAKAAEDSFRRAILRAILEAADRCITPAETADMCLLFLPSEAAYTILHDRFPDLVRDSQRARVWLVSPSTLMGTLHLVTSLLPGPGAFAAHEAAVSEARAREEEDSRLRDEVDSLRRRAASLADELDRTRGTLRDLVNGAEALGGRVETAEFRSPRSTASPYEPPRPPSNGDYGHNGNHSATPDWDTPVYRPERGVISSRLPGLYNDDRDDPLR